MSKIQINILIDAIGWELVDRNNFLKDDFVCRKKAKTILGYSSAAQPTILTGKLPNQHEQWAMFYYKPEGSVFKGLGLGLLDLLPSKIVHNHRIVRRLTNFIKKLRNITNYFYLYRIPFKKLNIFELSGLDDIYQPKAFKTCESIFDILSEKEIPYKVWNWEVPTELGFKELSEAIESKQYQFLFLYSPVMDSLMHAVGTKDEKVALKLNWFEEKVRAVRELAEKTYDDVEINIFSDHGMTDTKTTFDLMGHINKFTLNMGFSEGTDYLAFYDSTMARFWFFNDKARKMINKCLKTQEYGKILSEKEMKELGIYFEDSRYGSLVFLLDPGYLIVPSYMGDRWVNAMHGFSPNDEFSDAVFISNKTPDFEIKHIKDFFIVMKNYISTL